MKYDHCYFPDTGTLPIICYPLGSFILGLSVLVWVPITIIAPLIVALVIAMGKYFHYLRKLSTLGDGSSTYVSTYNWVEWYKLVLPRLLSVSFFTFLLGCYLAAVLSEFEILG